MVAALTPGVGAELVLLLTVTGPNHEYIRALEQVFKVPLVLVKLRLPPAQMGVFEPAVGLVVKPPIVKKVGVKSV